MAAVLEVCRFLERAGWRAWLVGGTVRDLLLGIEPPDIDLVTPEDPEPLARAFADSIGGAFFIMSERFSTCRVVRREEEHHALTWDFTRLRAPDIEQDLRERDFTVNAMAIELPDDLCQELPAGLARSLIDPLGGLEDLRRQLLVAVNEGIFRDDPLRLLRAPRLEKARGLAIAPQLEQLIKKHAALAARPAAERIWAELRILLEAPGTATSVERLDGLGLLAPLIPELEELKGVSQNLYHHLDVWGHTLANLEALDNEILQPEEFFPAHAVRLRARMDSMPAGDASWRLMMALASLLHDISKPTCRFTDTDGHVRFFEHDRSGARTAAQILRRLRASGEAVRTVSFLIGKHMRFEGLIQQKPPSQRARLRFIRATEPFTPELIMLSVSDRLSVRGPLVSQADVDYHLELTRSMMDQYFAMADEEPLPRLLGGEELIRELGLAPGPQVGRLLAAIREEQELGNIGTREEALNLARELHGKENAQ